MLFISSATIAFSNFPFSVRPPRGTLLRANCILRLLAPSLTDMLRTSAKQGTPERHEEQDSLCCCWAAIYRADRCAACVLAGGEFGAILGFPRDPLAIGNAANRPDLPL